MRTSSIISTVVILPLLLACRDSGTAPSTHRRPSGTAADAVPNPGGPGTIVFHVVNSGDVADLSASSGASGGPTTNIMVHVSRSGTPSDPHTMLFYSIHRCDGTLGCAFVEVGSGEIPNADFKGSGAVMTLVTNTSAASNPSLTRFVGGGGPIALEWRSDGFSSSLMNGTSEVRVGGSSRSEQGQSQTRSASVSGTLIALALPLPDGGHNSSIGTGQQEITIRNQ